MTQSNLPGSTPSASGATASLVTPPDHEIVYYEGRPLLRADQAKAAFWVLVGVALIALPILAHVFDWTWWAGWMTIVAILLAICAIVLPIMVMRTTRYRITSYRIDFERGLFTKRIDTLELWHVEDIKFE